MQNQSEPKPIYYYAVRSNLGRCKEHHSLDKYCTTCAGVGWHKAEQWDIVLLIKCNTQRFDGLYTFAGGSRCWLSTLTWEEFDLLAAFDVEWIDTGIIDIGDIKLVSFL